MSRARLFKIVFLPVLFLVLFLTSGRAFAGLHVEGDWNTSEGKMTVTRLPNDDIQVSYNQDRGRIIGSLEKTRFAGYWIEESSDRRCGSERDGSFYWGRVWFEFSADAASFEGKWGYCEDNPNASWNGTRIEIPPAAKRPLWMWGLVFLVLAVTIIVFFISRKRK